MSSRKYSLIDKENKINFRRGSINKSIVKSELIKVENDFKMKEKIKSDRAEFASDLRNQKKTKEKCEGVKLTNICTKCGMKFDIRSKLDAHFRMHCRVENKESLKSEIQILQEYHISGNLGKAKLNENNTIHKFKCKFCCKISQDKCKYDMHLRMHLKKLLYPCKECDETFEHLVNLARHISIVHRKHDPSRTECPICKKVVSAINPHLRTHQNCPIECDICGAKLKNYCAYKSHTRFHNILSNRGVNRAIVPKLSNLKNKCLLCKKVLRNKHLLISHMKSHIKLTLFPCPYCGDESNSLEKLIKHISSVHRSIPDGYVQCPQCAMIVSNIETHLKSHRLISLDCDMCDDVSFSRVATFWKHFNKKHKKKDNDRVIFIGRCFKIEGVPEMNYLTLHRCLDREI